ncbi:UNVERIFIED_CONTAM: hypothetical protein FKN15_002126 [Acipenser sinensis]
MQHALGDKTFCSICAVSQPRTLHRRLTEFNGAVSSASSAEPPPAPSAFKPFAGLQPIELAAAQDLLQGARNSTIATLVRAPPVEGLSKDPACLTGQCRITEAYLKKAYTAEAQVARLANTAGLLTAYLDGVLQSAPLPEPVASELRLVSGTLLQISGFQGQALDRSLAGLAVACRQLWLSQARVPDADKSVLLDIAISPGHTFRPAVEEILQHSHREREASRQVAAMLPSCAPDTGICP